MTWNIARGEELARRAVHDRYGGSRQSGIAPSARSGNVLLFSTGGGHRFGYTYDGWDDDSDVFHYTGEGQAGDQQFVVGNLDPLPGSFRGERPLTLPATDKTPKQCIRIRESPNDRRKIV